MTFGQIIFWISVILILALPAIVALTLIRLYPRAANVIFSWYGGIAGDLCFNNNTRSVAFFILAIFLTISAFIGGRGEPLLSNEIATVTEKVSAVKLPDTFKDFLWKAATNDGEITIKEKAPEVKKVVTPEKQAKPEIFWPSWWHWVVAIVVWLIAIVYFPLSRRDELFQLVGDLWNRHLTTKAEATAVGDEQPTGVTGSVVAGATNAVATVGRATGGYAMWKDVFSNLFTDFIGSMFRKAVRR